MSRITSEQLAKLTKLKAASLISDSGWVDYEAMVAGLRLWAMAREERELEKLEAFLFDKPPDTTEAEAVEQE